MGYLRPLSLPFLSLNKGFDELVDVTTTDYSLIHEVKPDTGSIVYIEGVHIVAENPSGSGVTLSFEVRALLDDGSEASIPPVDVAEGSKFDDWLRWFYDAIPNGRVVTAVRLYAKISAPTSTYPSIRLARVVGVQG